jgi:uncharacterized protein (DUF1778 family)
MLTDMAKQEQIHIRTTSEQKQQLAMAAEVLGTSVSDFMLTCALREAQDALLDQRIFYVTQEQYDEFQALLDDTKGNQARLDKLMSRPAPWEK